MQEFKVTVVGAGFVGATLAQRIVEKDIADVVLIDLVEGLPQGKALDIMESAPIEGFSKTILGTNDYIHTRESGIVVITAGAARKPGMSRDELLNINAGVIRDVVVNIMKYNESPVFIVVTNPLDVMCYVAYKMSGLKPSRIIGMAGILDSARYRYFIAEKLDILPSRVNAMVLGGHGDFMVPLPELATVSGKRITELMPLAEIEAIGERAKNGGAEIVGLLKKSSAYYAPSSSVVEMVKAIFFEDDKVLPCSVFLEGQYGIEGTFCGVPARLCRDGLKEVVELDISEMALKALRGSASRIKQNIAKVSFL